MFAALEAIGRYRDVFWSRIEEYLCGTSFYFCSLPWRFELCLANWRGSIALLTEPTRTRTETAMQTEDRFVSWKTEQARIGGQA